MKIRKKTSLKSNAGKYNTDAGVHASDVAEPVSHYVSVPATAASRTLGIMGMAGRKEFEAVCNENDFIDIIRSGIPRRVMDTMMSVADISLTEMASIVHTSDRTLRRYGPGQKLSQEQSERMIELARLYTRGEEVFGTLIDFRQWMSTSLLPFGNKKPKEFLDTSLGIGMIMEELGRIQYGVFA
jgi:putative toxin-antitoxin system antitoxin component (TIGR02293 family)